MSTPARSCHCPNCGGDVDERARRCGYCRAPIATLRCAHCYALNVSQAAHCAGCGRGLGLEPLGEPGTLPCPECRSLLLTFHGTCGKLLDCPKCGGQFVDLALLQALLEERETYGSALPRREPASNPLAQRVRYLPCPSCGDLMNRKNFGGTSGIIVDLCHTHGMWFDPGELPRVLSFVQAGGLARERRRERERRERERAARVAAAGSALVLGRRPESGPLEVAGQPVALLEVLDSLLSMISRAVGGKGA